MRVSFNRSLFLVAALALMPAAGSAEEKKADKDPNRMVCEKQEVVGSRLATKRVCMTAAEWETKRRDERQMIDRSQTQQRGPISGG
jgi:hypothetical protein